MLDISVKMHLQSSLCCRCLRHYRVVSVVATVVFLSAWANTHSRWRKRKTHTLLSLSMTLKIMKIREIIFGASCVAILVLGDGTFFGASAGIFVPKCDDSDVKALVIDGINNKPYSDPADVLGAINARIKKIEDFIEKDESQLKIVVTAEKRKAEIARLTEEIEKINKLVGNPSGSRVGYSWSYYEARFWEGTDYASVRDALYAFDRAYAALDDVEMKKLNDLVGLPAGNRDNRKFKKAANEHGWERMKSAGYEHGSQNLLLRELDEMRRLNIARHTEETENHNNRINESLAELRQNREKWLAAAIHVTNGVFSVEAIRETFSSWRKYRVCEANLQFKYLDKTQITAIGYTLLRDGSLFVLHRLGNDSTFDPGVYGGEALRGMRLTELLLWRRVAPE